MKFSVVAKNAADLQFVRQYFSDVTSADGPKVVEDRVVETKALDGAGMFVVSFVAGQITSIGFGLLTNLIYDCIKDKPVVLAIRGERKDSSDAQLREWIETAVNAANQSQAEVAERPEVPKSGSHETTENGITKR